MKCFETYRPRHARLRRISDPTGLEERDFENWAQRACGCEAGLARSTRRSGMRRWSIGPSTCNDHHRHTGGSSIPGSSGIWADHLIAMQPHVSFHVNGARLPCPNRDFPRMAGETKMRSSLHRRQPRDVLCGR